jgi:hypothetical protein
MRRVSTFVLPNTAETYAARCLIAAATDAWMRDIRSYEVIDGDSAPVLSGKRQGWCYRTAGGTYIRFPSAYSKRGWSNMVYHQAEWYTVTVGIEWLRSQIKTRAERRSFRAVMACTGEAKRKQRAMAPTVTPSLAARLVAYKASINELHDRFVEAAVGRHTCY